MAGVSRELGVRGSKTPAPRNSNRAASDHATRGRPPNSPDVPYGPESVRRAILDAAAELFAASGPGRVSLRDVAQRAGVNHALIGRYVGNRAQLIDAVYADLARQVAEEFARDPLRPLDFAPDAHPQQLFRLLGHLLLSGEPPTKAADPSPLRVLIDLVRSGIGTDDVTAAIRAAHLAATVLGWRLFEPILVEAAGLGSVPIEQVRDQHRRLLLSVADPSDH